MLVKAIILYFYHIVIDCLSFNQEKHGIIDENFPLKKKVTKLGV